MLRTFSSLQFPLAFKQVPRVRFGELKGIATALSDLLSSCAFRHGDMLRTRDEEGCLVLQCASCGRVTRVVETPAIKGPKFHPTPVHGTPQIAARRAVKPTRAYPRWP